MVHVGPRWRSLNIYADFARTLRPDCFPPEGRFEREALAPMATPKKPRVYVGTCSVPGCGRTLRARGLCATHYARWKATGTIDSETPVGGYRWTEERAREVAARVRAELLEPFRRVDAEIRFRCLDCGTEGVSSVHRMRRAKLACWPCSRIMAGETGRLSSERILQILTAAGYELVGEYRRSAIPVEVRCVRCGTHAFVRVDGVRSGHGCSACRYRWLSEHHRLEGNEVARRAAVARVELLEPFTSTRHAISVRCLECGYESRRTVDWAKLSPGCVQCGHRPYDFSAPSLIYLLRHREWPALKIGVTNIGSNRLADHDAAGWDCVYERQETGRVAYEVEQAVLAWWRTELKLGPYLSRGEMPQGGWTETVSSAGIEISEIIDLVEMAASLLSQAE